MLRNISRTFSVAVALTVLVLPIATATAQTTPPAPPPPPPVVTGGTPSPQVILTILLGSIVSA
jgi:hypothetical protein